MARQSRTRTEKPKRLVEKNIISCGLCGNDDFPATPARIKGIVRWVCETCKKELGIVNGR